jgi:Lipid A 3-O-deacylase (PagL)
MARAQVRLTDRVAITYWHWSNANIRGSNPSINVSGVSVRLRAG